MQIACITKVITITDSEWSKELQQTWPTSLKLINSLWYLICFIVIINMQWRRNDFSAEQIAWLLCQWWPWGFPHLQTISGEILECKHVRTSIRIVKRSEGNCHFFDLRWSKNSKITHELGIHRSSRRPVLKNLAQREPLKITIEVEDPKWTEKRYNVNISDL